MKIEIPDDSGITAEELYDEAHTLMSNVIRAHAHEAMYACTEMAEVLSIVGSADCLEPFMRAMWETLVRNSALLDTAVETMRRRERALDAMSQRYRPSSDAARITSLRIANLGGEL